MLRRTLCSLREIHKLMVANRGEIASRVFRSCRDLNIRTVALFCEAERNAKHVMEADEAVCIGPPPAANSYLHGDRIVEVAKRMSVDAIHPGYGFLSENAVFASMVTEANIEFIGPPSSAIKSMGSKSESKRIMESAGVPVVPGYHGDNQDPEMLYREAKRIGFPVLIKAVSGGGGKGMKIVEKESDFEMLLASAKREAMNFFKDDRVILERYIASSRHIECQIFCDKHGNGVFFFERDCSVQRRYQKVLEEAPAPHLCEATRQQIGSVAIKAAKAVGYVGAGTVEFIFDAEFGDFFFMEMNTRLQVEHPVTEEVCRIRGAPLDLVKLQIFTAMGKPLGFTQNDISLEGSCIEARVYAESPENEFFPESGRLRYIREPRQGVHGGIKTRLDTGFRQGDDVLIHYDPMISKLIVWGPNRSAALKGLRRALDEYKIVGIDTNVEFLKRCCDTKAFAEGGVTTKFIQEHQDILLGPVQPPVYVWVLAALSRAGKLHESFRLNSSCSVAVPFISDGAIKSVRLASNKDPDCVNFEVSGIRGTIRLGEVSKTQDGLSTQIVAFASDGTRYSSTILDSDKEVTVIAEGTVYKLQLKPLAEGFGDTNMHGGASAKITSPMPGKVAKFLVRKGDQVEKGQPILILEAMKMEHPIKAFSHGIVSFSVNEGDIVMGDQVMGAVVECAV